LYLGKKLTSMSELEIVPPAQAGYSAATQARNSAAKSAAVHSVFSAAFWTRARMPVLVMAKGGNPSVPAG
jgi:hypothetical protein